MLRVRLRMGLFEIYVRFVYAIFMFIYKVLVKVEVPVLVHELFWNERSVGFG